MGARNPRIGGVAGGRDTASVAASNLEFVRSVDWPPGLNLARVAPLSRRRVRNAGRIDGLVIRLRSFLDVRLGRREAGLPESR